MVQKCCVPFCNGNYITKTGRENAHVFVFPRDPVLRKRWLHAIPREDYVVTANSRVCHKHFRQCDILWEVSAVDEKTGKVVSAPLSRPRLASGAVPCIFPGCPKYLSSKETVTCREDPESRKTRKEADVLQRVLEESLQTHSSHLENISLASLDELKRKTGQIVLTDGWCTLIKESSVIFVYLDVSIQPHTLVYVVINGNLEAEVFCQGVALKIFQKCCKISTINDIEMLIEKVKVFLEERESQTSEKEKLSVILGLMDQMCIEQEHLFTFLKNQLHLCSLPKTRYTYDNSFIIFCSLFFSISPHAYKFFRNNSGLIMPHPNTIKKLCSELNTSPVMEQNPAYFLQYIKEKVPYIQLHEKNVVLMIDEIHLQPYLDFKGGNIVGACSSSCDLATSAHVFMLQSALSKLKEVVHILPVKKIDANFLYSFIKKVIIGLHDLGINVLAVVTDNNSINSKSMSFFANPPKCQPLYKNPANDDKLFFLIDSVHLFKCIRNNWLNQKTPGLDFVYPNFNDFSEMKTASFVTIRSLLNIEKNELLKFGYTVSVKALWPSSFERQNVGYVCDVFNDTIVNALNVLGKKHTLREYEGTAEFVKIISDWWQVVNVKSPGKGLRLNNVLQFPMTCDNGDQRCSYLRKFLEWLSHWEVSTVPGKLTTQTHNALKHTCECLLLLTDYCIKELQFSYLLPGKFQTDVLEARFGKYRQLAGGQYHVSVRQVFEIEKKIRLLNSLELPMGQGKKIVLKDLVHEEILDDHDYCNSGVLFHINVDENDLHLSTELISLLTYIAGYCVYSLLKKLHCTECEDDLIINDVLLTNNESFNLIVNLSRGALKYPSEDPVLLVTYTYIVVKQLLQPENERKFLELHNQRRYASDLIFKIFASQEPNKMEGKCHKHSVPFLCRNIIFTTCNILLKNYCKGKTDECNRDKFKSQRKRIKFSH